MKIKNRKMVDGWCKREGEEAKNMEIQLKEIKVWEWREGCERMNDGGGAFVAVQLRRQLSP